MSRPSINPEDDEDMKLFYRIMNETSRQTTSGGYDILVDDSQFSASSVSPSAIDMEGRGTARYPSHFPASSNPQHITNASGEGYRDPPADDRSFTTWPDQDYQNTYISGHNLTPSQPQLLPHTPHPLDGFSVADGGFTVNYNQSKDLLPTYSAQRPTSLPVETSHGPLSANVEERDRQTQQAPDNVSMTYTRSTENQTRDRFVKLYDKYAKKYGRAPSYWPLNIIIQMDQSDKTVIFGSNSSKPWTELINTDKVQLEVQEDDRSVVIKCSDPRDVLVYTLMDDTWGIFAQYNKSIKNITSASLDEIDKGGFLPVIACQSLRPVSERAGKSKNEIAAHYRSRSGNIEDRHNSVATEFSTSKNYPRCTECGDYSRNLDVGYRAKYVQSKAKIGIQ
ncbi:uncharacterized protein L199_004306 [Kwoniella botswanensis]|uniref:uncharacterized protein n=1 Tax=Kwoniella botswanensis TaxID=1268659 RepID=UPI00315D3ED3